MQTGSSVALTRGVPEYGLEPGDVGVIAFVWRPGEAYEVDFTTLTGRPIAALALQASDIRLIECDEIANARHITRAANQ